MLTGLTLVLLAVAAMATLTAVTGWAAATERASVAESRLAALEAHERHRQWLDIPRRPWTTTAARETTQPPQETHPMSPRIPQRIVTAVAPVLLAVIAVAGCIPQPGTLAPFTNPDPQARKVVVFGDSLGAMARDQAVAAFATHPELSVSYNAFGGTQAPHWAQAMTNISAGHCVIYELGTNDISNNDSHTAQWQTLAAFNELWDADRVVALTLNTTGAGLRGAPYAQRTREYNAFLDDLIASGHYPNLVVYDWDATSAGRTDWLVADHVHHTEAGNTAFAEALVDAAGLCEAS